MLWVAQIYIDQSDIPERNHQVTVMGLIYSKALAVLAWLGKSNNQRLETLGRLLDQIAVLHRSAYGETLTPQADGCRIQGRPINEEAMDQPALLETCAHEYSRLEESYPLRSRGHPYRLYNGLIAREFMSTKRVIGALMMVIARSQKFDMGGAYLEIPRAESIGSMGQFLRLMVYRFEW